MDKVKSYLLEEEKEVKDTNWAQTAEELDYISKLSKKLYDTHNRYNQPFQEFNGLTYRQYHDQNEEYANTTLNAEDGKKDSVSYRSGTIRNKLFSFISTVLNLNLMPDIMAYNKDDIAIRELGDGMEDVYYKADEMDNGEEKRMLRQYELYKQGTVFVESLWRDEWIIEKPPVKGYKGEFRDVKIKKKEVKDSGQLERNVISGLSVFLGDLTKYDISDQPYVFTIQIKNWEEVEQTYKDFENWKYVVKGAKKFANEVDVKEVGKGWVLSETEEEEVEVIKYQDKLHNEYQILINGVPMLPIGFPFPWGYEDYNIVQQNFKPIRENFAYGKSFIFENKNPINLLDEMKKLALLKTQKSFMPPYLNMSGKRLTSKMFMPGQVTSGVKFGTVQPINEKEVQGVTSGEFSMIKELQREIDEGTVSQTFAGSPETKQTTATQIMIQQQQAKMGLAMSTLAATLLEKKLAMQGLMLILQNWFEPIGEEVDKTRNELKKRYRITSRERMIDGEKGARIVIPTEDIVSVDQQREFEDKFSEKMGYPVRTILINPKVLKKIKLLWNVVVVPRERKSSETAKLMFNAMTENAMALGLQLNPEWVKETFAEVWEQNASKMFAQAPEMPPQQAQMQQGVQGQPQGRGTPAGGGISPQVKRPNVEVSPAIKAGI